MPAYTCKFFIEIKLLQLVICITRVFGCSKSPILILEKHNEVGRGKNSWASCKGIDNLMVLTGLPVSYDLFHYIFSLATISLPGMSK